MALGEARFVEWAMLFGRLAGLGNKTKHGYGDTATCVWFTVDVALGIFIFPRLKHASNFETVLSNSPFWNPASWQCLRLGTQNHRHFGKGRSCHSVAFATFFFFLSLRIRHFTSDLLCEPTGNQYEQGLYLFFPMLSFKTPQYIAHC